MRGEVKRFWCVFTLVALGLAVAEGSRWANPATRAEALHGWLFGRPADAAPYTVWFFLAGVAVGIGTRPRVARRWAWLEESAASPGAGPRIRGCLLALLCGAAAFGTSLWAGRGFDGWPPAYHDEFSYLFQAETFAAGRVSYPSFAPHGEMFDQMHVLNEGRFASRYFPGAGLWLLPFVRLGNPWMAQHLALGLLASFVFWAGRRLRNSGVGLLAGGLCAVSPGLILFSNTLLAHLPTLVGLGLFLVAMTRFRQELRWGDGLLAGCGLAFAMLCRPMTAAGFALPWGVWFISVLATGRGPQPAEVASGDGPAAPTARVSPGRRIGLALALGGPLAAAMFGMFFYNQAITGQGTVSPYQLYTDLYTPRHVYGFDNVTRGERKLGPKVLENYDRWAENLTPGLAARNVARRTISSFRWTLGIVPLTFALLWLLFGFPKLSTDWRLVLASIASLHIVHIPYWFEGIMGWHYVFESAPLLLLAFAEASRQIRETWGLAGSRGMAGWWTLLTALAVSVNLFSLPPLWPGTLPEGLSELAFSRRRYAEVEQRLAQQTGNRPAIIFIEPDPADRHIDYVYNTPSLDGRLLRARYRPDRDNLQEFVSLFPGRDAYLFRAATGDLTPLRAPQR